MADSGNVNGKAGINTRLAHGGNNPSDYFGFVNPPVVHASDIRCGNSHFGSSGCVCHAILPSFYRLWAVSRTRSMKPE